MKLYCKICGLPLTNELKLYTAKSFGEADKQHFIQNGFYTISDGTFFGGTEGKAIVCIEDVVNVINHTDSLKLVGCCGLGAAYGNKTCTNGHEVATEFSDCWMPYAIIFEKKNNFKIIFTVQIDCTHEVEICVIK